MRGGADKLNGVLWSYITGADNAIEAEIRGSPAQARLASRKERSLPLMASLHDWIQARYQELHDDL